MDPDGALRVVKYTADDTNGFQAEVIRNGISAIQNQLQQSVPTTASHPEVNSYNNNYNDYKQQPANNYSPDQENHHQSNQYQYHPSYFYHPTAVINHETPSIPTRDYNNNPDPTYNSHIEDGAGDGAGAGDGDDGGQGNPNPNDYIDNLDYQNQGEYRPQYEVHEEATNNEHDGDKEDADDQYKGKGGKKKVAGEGDKKKDHNDDDDDADEDDDSDSDDDDDDYDSDEYEDYDDAVKNNEGSDEYY